MSTYSSNLRIELISNGTQAGTWGDTTNNNLAYVLDSSIAGYQTVSVTSASQALTYTSGPTATASANQAIYAMLRFTTTTGAAFNVYATPNSKAYIVWNNSGYSMVIYNSTVAGNTTAAGSGVTVANGDKVLVWSDATNFYEIKSNSVTGTVAIANGGTGQTSAGAAFNALAPSQASANGKYLKSDGTNASWDAVDISTSDVSGTLAIGNGGTNATTASGARTNLGLAIGSDVPSPTGAGASGTWSISIGGNAATATSASSVSGTVAVANGGTGATSLTANNVLLGNGTSAVQAVAPSTSGNLLTSNGTTWVSSAPVAPDVQTFTSTGTWTKPTGGQTMARIMVWGGGGGGTGNPAVGGSGGYGGGYNEQIVPLSYLASTVTATVGAGGAGGYISAGVGGNSSFALATSFNGKSTVTASGGACESTTVAPAYIFAGGGGGVGGGSVGAYGGYAGGGGANSAGGDSYWGGAGGFGTSAGTAPGGGGGSNSSGFNGGSGGNGRIIVMCW
jgi:hypothetical protein